MEELIFSYENGVIDSANVKLAFGRALNKILQVNFLKDYFVSVSHVGIISGDL
jgi:hypothetical protein